MADLIPKCELSKSFFTHLKTTNLVHFGHKYTVSYSGVFLIF